MPNSLDTSADISQAVKALCQREPRFHTIHAVTGDPPLRRVAPGLASLLQIITDQMLSRHAARAIWSRTLQHIDPADPTSILDAPQDSLRAAGQSRAKIQTFRAIATAINDSTLQLDTLTARTDEDAIAHLATTKGVGPWTAHIYLLTCLGCPDIFPAADVALQSATQHAFELDTRPTTKELTTLAEPWQPHRATAARLLWGYYGKIEKSS